MKEDLLKIINHYGVMPQLKYFQSEVFELNEAIIEYENVKRFISNVIEMRLTKQHIVEEIADVQVMLDQLQHYFEIEDKDILDMMQFKVNRQLDRIKREKVTLQEKSDSGMLQ